MLVQMAVYGNLSLEDAIYREFMDGGPPTPNHQKLLDSIDWLKKNDLKMGSKSFWYVVGIGFFFVYFRLYNKHYNFYNKYM